MIEDNNKTSLYFYDFVDLINLIVREIKKILMVILLSMSSWYIYYISHNASYNTSIFIDEVPVLKFNYIDILVSNFLSTASLGNVQTQFLNNATEYSTFKNFFVNQKIQSFDSIEDFYRSISILDGPNSSEKINFSHKKITDQIYFNNSILDYLDYVQTITLENILNILYVDLNNINTDINDANYKNDLTSELLLSNNQHELSENLLRDEYNIKKTIRLLKENILIAENLGYMKPIGNIESYLYSSVAPISQANNVFVDTVSVIQSLSSDKPLFFLGTSVLKTYLDILDSYNAIDIETKRTFYPDLSASIEIDRMSFDEKYIELITSYKVLLKQTNRTIEMFEKMKNEPNLVRYDRSEITTTSTETNYKISFMISIFAGLITGVFYALLLDMYRRKNHIS